MTPQKNIPYVDRLRSELMQSVSRQQRQSPSAWWKTRTALMAAAASVLAGGAITAVLLTGNPSGDAPPGPPIHGNGNALGSCVEQFSLEALARRDFAFDGTVREVIPPQNPEAEGPAAAGEVVFEVHRWYKGGAADSITLRTYELPGVITSIEGSLDLSIGSRLLASGDDVYLWSCGFSMPYTEGNAQLFEEAFGT